jgi:hypothetical protein
MREWRVVQIAEPFDGTHKVFFLFFIIMIVIIITIPEPFDGTHQAHTFSKKKKVP